MPLIGRVGFRPGLLCLLLAGAGLLSAQAAVEETVVYRSGEEGYNTFRIPAVVKAASGDLLAFAEGRKNGRSDTGDIDLLLKRSTDGGKTWGALQVLWDDGTNTCGNPCALVDEQTGVIWIFSTHNLGKDTEKAIDHGTATGGRTVWVLQSQDHGATWSKPREITATVKKPEWTWYATGPGIGIQIKHGPHAGRLVLPCDHNTPAGKPGGFTRGSHAIYSDDHGATWQLGGFIRPGMNECQVAELFGRPGTLLMDMRSYAGRSRRAQSTSDDGGLTWTAPLDAPALVEPVCQASLLRWETAGAEKAGWLLFSNPADPKKRLHLTVRASADDGATWSRQLELHAGPAAYSCLVALDATTAACFYERGEKQPYETLVFARFTAADLVAP